MENGQLKCYVKEVPAKPISSKYTHKLPNQVQEL